MSSNPIEDPGSRNANGVTEPSSVGHEMAKAGGWMIAARLGVQAIGFISTIILARILVPADFGLVALATTFSAALQAVSEFSLDVVLIQNQSASREHYDTAWTLSICRNTALALCLAAGAPSIASLLGDQRLTLIVYFIAASTFVDGLANIGIVNFQKNLTFHKDTAFMIVGKLGGFVVTVPLAFLWKDYWALVAGLMAGSLTRLALSYLMHSYRPRLSLARWREIMNFSKWLLLNNVCAFVFSRSDTFVIGKILGAQAVGIYGIAYEIANLTTSNLVTPLRRASFPGYAKVSADLDNLRMRFLDVIALVLLIGAPMAVGIGTVASPLVHVMLGPQWLGSIPLIQVLSIYGLLSLLGTGSGPIFLATAKPQYIMYILGGSAAVMVPSLIIGVGVAGALGAAWAVTMTAALTVCIDFWLITRLLGLRITVLMSVAWRSIAASCAMVLAVLELQDYLGSPVSTAGWAVILVEVVAAGILVYAGSLFLLWALSGFPDGAERHALYPIRYGIGRLRATLTD